jgi:hypothetical protein
MVGFMAALALLATGCGGTSTSATGEAGSAAIVPASTPVFVSVDSDLSSDQWQQVDALLEKFPGRETLLAKLRKSFEEDANGVTWEDVKAALGPEVGVAVLELEGSTVVGLTQPKDEAKWEELLRKGNKDEKDKLYSIDYEGWKVFADTQVKLNRFKELADAAQGKLADDATFKEAFGQLADPALAKAYANGARLTAAAKEIFERLNAVTPSQGRLKWLAGDLVAEDDGVRMDVRSKSEGATLPGPYTAKLVDVVPAGVLAFVSFNGEAIDTTGLRKQFEQGFGSGAGSFPEAQQFLKILEQLLPLFAHETALYVRPGAGIPEVTLVAQPDSPQRGVAAIDRLVKQLAATGGVRVKTSTVRIGQVKAKEVNLGPVSIYYGADGKRVVVSDTQQAFLDLKGKGSRLADDPTFKEALKAGGMPEQTNGFLYVNLKDAIPLLTSFAQLAGGSIDPQTRENLRPLRAVVAWEAADGGNGEATLFLEIK